MGGAAAPALPVVIGRALLLRAPAAPKLLPPNLMYTSEIGPIFKLLHQSRSLRILPHILPLLRVTLGLSQAMMKFADLKRARVRVCFRKAILPERHPPLDGEFEVARPRKRDEDGRA